LSNYYTIMRVSSEKFYVVLNENVVVTCSTYKEAENFIFLRASEELLKGIAA